MISPPGIPVLASLAGAGKRYGAIAALDGVDLELRGGEVHALLGANGAGKSTAIALLLGLLEPDAGTASLFGLPPQSLAARRGVGLMLQSATLQDTLQVQELLELTRSYYATPRSVEDCVDLAGLDGLMPRRYGKLSGGQQRRVQFALAICGRPRVLFLDEPTTGLDIEARQGLWRAIRELRADGAGVLLTTHYLEEAEALSDRVTVLARGRIAAAGTMRDVRARVAQRRIRCVSSLDADAIARWPRVRSAIREDENIAIVTDADAEDVIRRLLAEDAALRELEVHRAGLSDAFLELTRETRADSALKEAA